jgi:hypothetical protein
VVADVVAGGGVAPFSPPPSSSSLHAIMSALAATSATIGSANRYFVLRAELAKVPPSSIEDLAPQPAS